MNIRSLGMMKITSRRVEIAPGRARHEITDVVWEGPPITLINDFFLGDLPDWAIAHDGQLIQIGPYVLRRTSYYESSARGYYWAVADQGELHWLYWRCMEWLENIGARLVLTLAVWGLAEWPRDNTFPSWRDIKRRWGHWAGSGQGDQ